MAAVRAYEWPLVGKLIKGLQAIPGVTLYGMVDPFGFDRRAPTVAFTLQGTAPRQVVERLGVEEHGGMVRVGVTHYNTPEEVERLLAVVNDLASGLQQ